MSNPSTSFEYSKILCPNCNANYDNKNYNSNIINDSESGENLCGICGIVLSIEKSQELGPEWRTFNTAQSTNRLRIGMPTSLARHDMGLSTIIGRSDKDYSGNTIDTSVKSTIDRPRILDYRTQLHSSTDRSLKKAFSELDILTKKNDQGKNSLSYACCCHIYSM
jgi:transcription initiation factor TFIIB